MTITRTNLDDAAKLGETLARMDSEFLLEPRDNPVEGFDEALDDYENRKALIYRVTGNKIEPDSEDGWMLMDAFENGYYDEWEEIDYGTTQSAA